MRYLQNKMSAFIDNVMTKMNLGLRAKLITVFLVVKVIPLILIMVIALRQFIILGTVLREIAVTDSSEALNDSAVESIERLTTDTALSVAEFLYARDDDILYVAQLTPSQEAYKSFSDGKSGRVITSGEWKLSEDGQKWEAVDALMPDTAGGVSTNVENNDMDGFHYRTPDGYEYDMIPLYDEITFIDVNGQEIYKYVSPGSPKKNYPLSREKRDVSKRENTYVKAETYFEKLTGLAPGEIYVSDVIGAYVGSDYIGMYTPDNVEAAANDRGYDIPYEPENQAYAGMENPNGERFEGIMRWATPVTDGDGAVIGYVTLALNHDHIMEFVDHITPMNERYTELPSAYEGNYAFIWDYQCRSICHPRHHSIVGVDPETGNKQIPWLETSIYDAWQESGISYWYDFAIDYPQFDSQSRSKKPASALTQAGLVGLDGRYLNNAPQCTGWMNLTEHGGSGSFYILWSGLYKLTTAAAIPYYTGQYAPNADNNYSKRGFGIVTIGAGLEDFTRPATETEVRLTNAISENMSNTLIQLILSTAALIALVVMIAIGMASSLTGNITRLIEGISHFRSGERQFRFRSKGKDEFGTLADSFDDMADSIEESVNSPMSITDMDGKIIYMNEQGLDFVGKTLDEVVGMDYAETSIYPNDPRYFPITALQQGYETEIYYVKERGRYIRGTASYFLSHTGEKLGYIIITSDVTEMVLERNKIEEQRTLLDSMFSASPDLIWYINANGVYLMVNPRFASVAGRPIEEFTGKSCEEMLSGEEFREFVANERKAVTATVPMYTEEKIRFSDEHEEVLDAVRTPIRDASGALVGVLGFARNVTTRVKIENELRNTQNDLEKAVDDANRANEHKGEFLARMSHEIRTPMNAIIGLTNIIERKLNELPAGNGVEEVKDHIHQLEISSQHLLGLLNDILDISKIEAGKIELSDDILELPKLYGTVVGIIKPRCDEKNIKFVTELDTFSPSIFIGDSLRLRQVLINLLGNAVKFTPELGQIEFKIHKLDRADSKALIEFTVRDNGIGISEERLKTIFMPFEQADNKISRQYGGTGLGLSISSRIVQLFGGEIAVESKLKEGSTFVFSIWLKEAEAEAENEDSIGDITNRFADKRALLVDDVEINRMIVTSLLEITGMQIDEAADGIEAVEAFKQSPEGTYDMIFMDVQMPNMDGYEATQVIRALDREDAKRIPIIALTANAFKDDIDKALSFGMNAHITKPVDMDKMVEMLVRFLKGR